jgi:hypothetical protein
MKVGRQVGRWQSSDGKHVLRIFARAPDCFYFVELSELTDNEETFWTTTITSDESSSLDDVKREALAQVAWLQEVV